MNIESFPLESDSDGLTYYFDNAGDEVVYPSAISYTPIYDEHPDTYNLAFGVIVAIVVDGETRYTLDDKIVTDNKNRDTVLATVIKSIFKFWEKYPNKSVFIIGSTPARTRMYRGIIGNYGYQMADYAKFYSISGNTRYPFMRDTYSEGFIIEPLMDDANEEIAF